MKGKTIKYAMVFSVLLLVLVFTASAAALKTGSLNVNGASVEISLEDATTVSIKYPGAKGSEDILDLASAAAKASPEYFDKAAVVIQKKDAATISLAKSMSTGAFDEFISNFNKKAAQGAAVLVIDRSAPEIPYYVWILLAVLLFLLLLLFVTTGDKYRYAALPGGKPEEGEPEAEEAAEAAEAAAEEPAEEPAAEEVAAEEEVAEEPAEEAEPEAAEEPAAEAEPEEAAEEEAAAEEPAEPAEEAEPEDAEEPAEEAIAEEPEAEEAAAEPKEAAEEGPICIISARTLYRSCSLTAS